MTRWLRDLADAQGELGNVPPVVPNVETSFRDDGGPAWADAAIICPWTIYLCYGDRRILDKTYPVMTKFMEFLLNTSPGFIRCAPEYEGWPGFGDWLSINASTPRDLIGTAFLAYDASLMARITTILDKPQEAARYRQIFAEVKQAFADRYLKGSQVSITSAAPSKMRQQMDRAEMISRGNLKAVDYEPVVSQVFNTDLFRPTQTAYVLALHFDLLPDNLRPLAVAELVADIEGRDQHLSTGFVGAPYLPHVLSSNGRLDMAYRLLYQKTWPSWLYPITVGATTIWERWDGWTEENGFQDPGMNSFNHYAYGAIGDWLYRVVAGIELDPQAPGYKRVHFWPQPDRRLSYARAGLDSMYGRLESAWRLKDGRFLLAVTVPANTQAVVYLPVQAAEDITEQGQALSQVDGIQEVRQENVRVMITLGSGRYQFSIPFQPG